MTRRDEILRKYLTSLTSSGDLSEVIEESVGAAEAATSADEQQRILQKLATGASLTPQEYAYTEAIIIPDRRPAVDIIGGTYLVRHADWLGLNEAGPRARLEPAFASIGRVELPGHPSAPYGGTAFLVGPDLMMTNRHVAEFFAQGLGTQNLRFISGRTAAVDLLREHASDDAHLVDVTAIVMIHPYWDMALLRVTGVHAHTALTLNVEAVESFVGNEVAVVGYPAFDPRNTTDTQNRIFGGVYGVKRLQPGILRGRFATHSYGRLIDPPTHDSSTLGGNSGSCVIDVTTGTVIGLHFAGRYLDRNWCVAASDLARDGRVIDAGVAFVGTPSRGYVPWDEAWRQADALSGAEGQVRPADNRSGQTDDSPTSHSPASSAHAQSNPMPVNTGAITSANGEVQFTIPLQVSFRLGDPPVETPGSSKAVTFDTSENRQRERPPRGKPFWDPKYSTRKGYDPHFLGRTVPMPTPRAPYTLVHVPGGGTELKYHHFSLFMHRERRIAAMSAANVDNSEAVRSPGNRPSQDYSRDGLAGRSNNAWFLDARINPSEQLAEAFFENDRGAFDKGHVVRRDDVAWGVTYQQMRNANGDSFHVTNCAPQVSSFNQFGRGEDNWGDLVNLILGQAEDQKLQVFGGPVFDEHDPVFTGRDHAGPVKIKIPVRYWKLVVARKNDALEAFGFLLEQDLGDVPLEFSVPMRWRSFTVSVAHIERLSGFDFAPAIRNGDQITTERVAPFAAAGIPFKPDPGGELMPEPETTAPRILLEDVADVLALWREQQQRANDGDGADDAREYARFVIELDRPISDETIRQMLEKALDLNLEVGPLFPPDAELDRFRAVDVPGIGEADRADLFDTARVILALLDVPSVEPDLDTRYFDSDPIAAPDGTAENAGLAFWCWADDDQKPPDPDWAIKKVRLPEAWKRSKDESKPTRGKGSVIFQPDSGVVTNHPDVPANSWNDPRAANFVERGKKPIDPMTGPGNLGHGTATGSVAASRTSGKVRGAAPQADLVPLRCLRSVVRFNQSPVAEAVDHARRNGAHIITMSLGGAPGFALKAACRKAVRENVLVMAAAGNCVGTVVWPALYDDVIAVGGVNHLDKPWQGSSRGSSVAISAPAEFVLRADASDGADPGKVGGGQGTSFATAMLSGVAACWLAHHGRDDLIVSLPRGITLQDLFLRTIKASARIPAGFDTSNYGAGIVDADALLALDPSTVAASEAIVAQQTVGLQDQVEGLLADIFGGGSTEAAVNAVQDPVSLLELACVGLDAARYRRNQLLEAQPPQALSSGLKRSLGPLAEGLMYGNQQ